MSKSLAETRRGHAIGLADPPDLVRRTIMEGVTDSGSETRFEHASPGVKNLLTIFKALSRKPRFDIEAHFKGKGYRYLKAETADLVIAVLGPIREKYLKLMDDPLWLDQMLRHGAQRVSSIAFSTLDKVKRLTGIEHPKPRMEKITYSEGVY